MEPEENEEERLRRALGDFGDAAAETEALFAAEPYALVIPQPVLAGSWAGEGEDVTFVIHKEISNEAQCVLLFESIVDALTVAEDYRVATGETAEPRTVNPRHIEDRFWVKYYSADGGIFLMPIQVYRERAT